MRCKHCQDSKVIMGGGMIYQDCICVTKAEYNINVNIPIDKRSKQYKDSINKIMKLHGCSREESAMIFEEEYNKI